MISAHHEVTSDNGISVNGISVNGISVNGISVNGISVNGISVNGISVNGISVNGISVNGISLDGLYINGIGLNGVGLDGIGVNEIGVNNPGSFGVSLAGIGLPTASLDAVGSDGAGLAGHGLRGVAINGLYVDGSGMYGINVNGAGLIDVPLSGFDGTGLVVNGSGPGSIGLGSASVHQDSDLEGLHLGGTQLRHIGLNSNRRAGKALDGVGLNGLFLNGSVINRLSVDGQPLTDVALNDLVVNGDINGILRTTGNGQLAPLSPKMEKALDQVLFHLAACALPAGDAITITTSNGTLKSYPGLRGFAPEWAEMPLTTAGAERVRACLTSSEGTYQAGQFPPDHERVLETVLFHLVACALPAGDSVSITAADGTPRVYEGLRGFAPRWKTQPLDDSDAERVRTCLRSSPDAVFDLALNQEQEANMKKMLTYTVQCALPAGESVTIYDSTGAPVELHGSLGLAPEWATGPLSQRGELQVSACLAARSNPEGLRVNLSLRGSGLSTTAVERAVYRHHEGAFWGNLFDEEPHIYACSVDGAGISGRACTADGCGFEHLGSCDEVCTDRDPVDGHYTNCAGASAVINTFLYLTDHAESGQEHNCVRRNGTLWCWGDNHYGQLGDGTLSNRLDPLPVLVLGDSVAEFGGGAQHTCARRDDGSVWCWGDNHYGQLGTGAAEDAMRMPAHVSSLGYDVASLGVAENHACALTTAGTLWCWGDNFHGQLGTGTASMHDQPVQLAALGTSVVRVAMGDSARHTCALTGDGTPWCWGWNGAGQLGNGTTDDGYAPQRIAATADRQPFDQVTDLCTGWLHTCARRADGSAWCWGSNASGQLGNDAAESIELHPVQVSLDDSVRPGSLSCGANHACAVLTNGSVQCWGNNEHGQLGGMVTDGEISSSPLHVAGLSSAVSSVSADGARTCASMEDDTFACWGHDATGLLLGMPGNNAAPVLFDLPTTRRYAPVGFEVRFDRGNKDVLRWDAHLAPDLDGYQIYEDGLPIATVSKKRVRWHRRDPIAGACYAVRATFTDGTVSELTETVCPPQSGI